RVEELHHELLEEKELTASLQSGIEKLKSQNEIFKEVVIDKFYHVRQRSLDYFCDVVLEEKCECLLNDSNEMWRFQDYQDTATNNYINSLETEFEIMKKSVNNLQNRLQVGLDIEAHLKKTIGDVEKTSIVSVEKIRNHVSGLVEQHSHYRADIKNLLDQWYAELKSINDLIVEKMFRPEPTRASSSPSSPIQEKEVNESECKDVHVSGDSSLDSLTDPEVPVSSSSETFDTSKALSLALQEKVQTLLLLSQQDERHLLDRNVNALLEKRVVELQRNLLQVTNEKVKALMELAALKQELKEAIVAQGRRPDEIGREKEGGGGSKIKSMLKRASLTRWVGGVEGDLHHDKSIRDVDFTSMKIENATLKESLESMNHLLCSVQRLRISLEKIKESAAECADDALTESVDRIIAEGNLLKTALGSSIPVVSGGVTAGQKGGSGGYECVTAVGVEMVELLITAADILKHQL
ncbi:hypothetical protein M569_00972, partial [Genlisea aurea]